VADEEQRITKEQNELARQLKTDRPSFNGSKRSSRSKKGSSRVKASSTEMNRSMMRGNGWKLSAPKHQR